ncbi:MAG: hypothetical protein A3G33_09275 [Omnitrophica bacterium RIFCSPLOWO2_12_FULL_44_17]|uniref:Uncharacterized protein n=1 Tax=Candidatus Danuiimicrobium aquiferis TaxID=1801832 RepID=A0A1G1L005_9BACT|nr:MAG: hypothetical protein A3B72_06045 [Omnitrophica bacterium RIFCSPHIGHO2_02_FULL_45_28]OGW90889.1 MAG: hypothetical protein A3E74_04140 [Omnitrophica bacterium RIFCSPHIGHO2_12_FULL_44_12]OGW98494.1 MAG: hypothetical protein A3G33_09275 [Omnitrophica bacterium RIFCSPLOWO2_12_FULL_44_17]OGX02940.1 MAG: hypothetical protein A3J12_11270 [Omnitrophica bacterium RIFCSPLOWO2_02_FULL_44_11]
MGRRNLKAYEITQLKWCPFIARFMLSPRKRGSTDPWIHAFTGMTKGHNLDRMIPYEGFPHIS